VKTLRAKVVKLHLKGPLTHIPASDTIFGAIANATSLLMGNEGVEELIRGFQEGARISSAFPFAGEVLYFPKPLTLEMIDDGEMSKRIKRAKCLDKESFELALSGKKDVRIPQFLPYKEVEVPRVALDRVTNDSSLYFWREVRFEEGAGVYFLYTGSEGFFRNFIKPSIKLLGDSGLGGKATWGFGVFEPEFNKVELRVPESSYHVVLSNTLPTKAPVLWKIYRKGGWVFKGGISKRKPKMTFLKEGSIITDDPGRIEILNLGLGFKVYIYGLSFKVPITLEGLS